MTAVTPCLHCKVIDVVRSCSSCWKLVDFGSGPRPRKFWYFFTSITHGYANRSKLGSWIWDRQSGQTTGDYANQLTPLPAWFNGVQADMPPEVPCRTCPDTCDLFYGWPTFTRCDIHVEQVGGPGVWDYAGVTALSQDASLVSVTQWTTGEPNVNAFFNRDSCRATILDFSGSPVVGGFVWDNTITDPAYVFTSFSLGFVTLQLTSGPTTTAACFWRIRWYADPP